MFQKRIRAMIVVQNPTDAPAVQGLSDMVSCESLFLSTAIKPLKQLTQNQTVEWQWGEAREEGVWKDQIYVMLSTSVCLFRSKKLVLDPV